MFYLGCMPVRLGLAYATSRLNEVQLKYAGIAAAIAGILFILVWATNSRLRKGAFGGSVWWAQLRPIHGLIYIIFALNALSGNRDSYKWLIADAGLGFASFY